MLKCDMAIRSARSEVPATSRRCPTWSSSAGVSRASRPRRGLANKTCASRSSTSTTSTRSCRCSTRWPPRCSSPPTSPTRSARSSATPRTSRFRHGRVRSVDHARSVVVARRRLRDRLRPPRRRHGRHGGVLRRPRRVAVRHAALLARRRAATAQPPALVLEDADVAAPRTRPVALTFVIVGGDRPASRPSGALSELITIAIRRDGLRLDPLGCASCWWTWRRDC